MLFLHAGALCMTNAVTEESSWTSPRARTLLESVVWLAAIGQNVAGLWETWGRRRPVNLLVGAKRRGLLNKAADVFKVSKHFQRLCKLNCCLLRKPNFHTHTRAQAAAKHGFDKNHTDAFWYVWPSGFQLIMDRMHNKSNLNSGFFFLALQKTLKFLYFKLSGQFILLFLKSGEGGGAPAHNVPLWGDCSSKKINTLTEFPSSGCLMCAVVK